MDLEMTGLEPSRHVIVEIATLITDDDLNIIAEGPDLVVHQDDERLGTDGPGGDRDAHAQRAARTDPRLDDVAWPTPARRRWQFIKTHVTEARRVPLCGNSIGMDRRFLAAYLPEIEEYLHYRSVDVSTVKELVKRWYPALNSSSAAQGGLAPGARRRDGEHRRDEVLPRAMCSCRRLLRRPPGAGRAGRRDRLSESSPESS